MEANPALRQPRPIELGLAYTATTRRLVCLLLILGIGWLPALIGQDSVREAAALSPLAWAADPYFVPQHGWLLYVWTPLVAMSAVLLFLSPGVLLALTLGLAESVAVWVLSGFFISLVEINLATLVVQGILGSPVRGGAFAAVVVACSLASALVLLVRAGRSKALNWPLARPFAWATILSMVIGPIVLLLALAPKFYWESFNGDGAHSFEATRLLLWHSLPFWNPAAGDLSDFPGVTSVLFTYVNSWFLRLFGETEASVRLTLLLDLVVLYAVLLALIEFGRSRAMSVLEQALLWLGLAVFVVSLAYSATYSPYSADLALPATMDTLAMACFLTFVLSFARRAVPFMLLSVVLTYVSSPNGLLLIGFWVVAVVVAWRPRPWRQLGWVAAGLVGCYVGAAVLARLLAAFNQPTPGDEYGLVGLASRFAFLQFADWHRLLYVIVPAGILPVAALLTWGRQSPVARSLTLVTVAYFAFFYVQGHIVLHHFIPAMLLPLIVFWQSNLVASSRFRSYLLVGAGLTGVLALVLALPRSAMPDTSGRLVGAAFEDRIGGYETMDPAVFKRSELTYELLPVDWLPSVPEQSYGASALVWNFYMHHPGPDRVPNYVFQRSEDPPPAGARLVVEDGGTALYVLSEAVLASHLGLRPPTPAGSPVIAVPRWVIFRGIEQPDGPPIYNMVDVLTAAGVDVDPIFKLLHVQRSD